MAIALAGALALTPFGAARAQEAPEVKPLKVTKAGYWSRSLGHAAPPALTNHFPPTVVCLVAPQFCNSPLAPVLAQGDALAQSGQPEDTVPSGDALAAIMVGGEDHLPTGVFAGARRYLSAVQFEMPPVPEGERVSKFEISLTPVEQFTFHFDSPGFRQAILAVLRLIQSEDPAAFREEMEKVGNDNHPATKDVPLGVEACPIVEGFTWEGTSNQDADTAPERDTDERSGETPLPKQVDCGLGANAKVQDGKWVFDLTFAANAWNDGKMPNNGVLLRPVLPPNLAYGDPDISTFDQVVFYSPATAESDDALPKFALVTKEKSKPVTLSRNIDSQVLGAQASSDTFAETFSSIDRPLPVLDAPAPAVQAPSGRGATVPALSGTPVTEWWVWLLLPMFLAGVYLTTQALTSEPALVTASRSGAMTRLIEARRRGDLI